MLEKIEENMLSEKELELIFNQKKQKVERKITKTGIVKERIIGGFEKISFQQFKDWYARSNYEKGCFYCQTTAERSLQLYNNAISGNGFNWTRGGKRGRRLEIDRKDPFKHYDDLENLVWCCYWCNNAKSNFFSVESFIPIAKEIGRALNKM